MIRLPEKESKSEALRILSEAQDNYNLEWALIHLARVVLRAERGEATFWDKKCAAQHIQELELKAKVADEEWPPAPTCP